MARLPIPGSDAGNWGQILNDYLAQVHDADGSFRDNVIPESALANSVQTKINAVAGQQGATGATGPAGSAGTTGATGATGGAGATGATGPQGTAGTIGAAGAIGATGAQGTAGVTGAAGATGATGPAGSAGTTGATGATGGAGATGATGPQGTAGTIGATGATGPAGNDGTSVTIAGSVANAAALPGGLGTGDAGDGYLTNDDGHLHVWSGTAWTDVGEIRGPQGATGPQGPSGATGTAGSNGATGATGPIGATGTQGPSGTAGTAGATGATGPAGATTIAGISGLQAALDSKAASSHTHAASDIASGTLTLDRAIPGTTFDVIYDGADWKHAGVTISARPTARTDLVMQCVNPIDATTPAWAIAGDRLLRVG